MRVLNAGKCEVMAIGFAPGRPVLVASCVPGGVRAWDLSADGPPVELGRRLRSITFTPDGDALLRPDVPRIVAVDLATGQSRPFAPEAAGGELALSPDGTRLVLAHGTAWYFQTLSGWRLGGGGWSEQWTLSLGHGAGAELVASPAGDRFAHLQRTGPSVASSHYQLLVRDSATGAEVGRAEYPYSYSSRLLFRPGGAQLVGVHEMTILVWDLSRAGRPRAVRNDTRKHFTAAAFHPSGRYLFSTSNDKTVLVWDAEAWEHVSRFTWNVGRLKSVAVSADGTLAAAGSDKGRVVVWDVDL